MREAPEGLPWERHRSASAWWQTVWLVTLRPRDAAHAMAPSGSLAHALTFAALAFLIHTSVGATVIAVIVWLQFTYSLERFEARDPVGRILAMSDAVELLASAWLVGPVMVLCAGAVLVGLTRLLAASLPLREYLRAVLYACAVFAVATIPIVGPLALLVLPAFLHHWLGARTSLSTARRGISVVAAVVTGWWLAGGIAEGFLGALGTLPHDVVSAVLE